MFVSEFLEIIIDSLPTKGFPSPTTSMWSVIKGFAIEKKMMRCDRACVGFYAT